MSFHLLRLLVILLRCQFRVSSYYSLQEEGSMSKVGRSRYRGDLG